MSIPPLVLRQLLRQARASGLLNIAQKSLRAFPPELLSYEDTPEGENWWEHEPVAKVKAHDNLISQYPEGLMVTFRCCTLIDLHNNELASLPEDWGGMQSLAELRLGHNKLARLPASLFQIPALTILDASHNLLTELPECRPLARPAAPARPSSAQSANPAGLRPVHTGRARVPQAAGLRDTVGFPTGEVDPPRRELAGVGAPAGGLFELYLGANQIRQVPPSLVALIAPTIRQLDLSQNRIGALPQAISECEKLTRLVVSGNRLTDLPPLRNLRNLATLGVHLTLTVPFDGLGERRADLRENCLTRLPALPPQPPPHPDAPQAVPALVELFAARNGLASLDEVLPLSNLRTLDYRENKVSEVPEGLTRLEYLGSLDLTMNGLEQIPAFLGFMPRLRVLLLEGNPCRALRREILAKGSVGVLAWLRSRAQGGPDDPSEPPAAPGAARGRSDSPQALLETEIRNAAAGGEVNLEGRGLAEVPAIVFEQPDLRVLRLARNKLTQLPDAVGQLRQLTSLDLTRNQLAQIPTVRRPRLHKPPSRLHITLTHLGQALAGTDVHELLAAYNQIRRVPDLVLGMPLTALDLSGNPLGAIDLSGAALLQGTLQALNLSMCRLTRWPEGILLCRALRELKLSDNKIPEIPAEVNALRNLELLDLTNNSVRSLPYALCRLPVLRGLLLEGNLIVQPRRAVLEKGTPAVLKWLEERGPES
ncbi:putative leucine-rich repeat family protein [Paratrimastix pyriformis]|uniref:Leucine-rich repeat family protein n=1 Tax=Paratrimastix pyriformis TaxID=342808 RepID=A0ABQ8UCI2_9EUKA|nr:putative leucine-rich repeat family protein [Paratrimastix pyriformis]